MSAMTPRSKAFTHGGAATDIIILISMINKLETISWIYIVTLFCLKLHWRFVIREINFAERVVSNYNNFNSNTKKHFNNIHSSLVDANANANEDNIYKEILYGI